MKTLQYQLANGSWIDCGDRTNEFLEKAEKFIGNHPSKTALLDGYDSVSDRLNAGRRVDCGTGWYSEIRYKPAPRPVIQVEMKKCDCGCTIPKSSVMSASLGSSCPDCYDRMSV